jgi:hypothetical protein
VKPVFKLDIQETEIITQPSKRRNSQDSQVSSLQAVHKADVSQETWPIMKPNLITDFAKLGQSRLDIRGELSDGSSS